MRSCQTLNKIDYFEDVNTLFIHNSRGAFYFDNFLKHVRKNWPLEFCKRKFNHEANMLEYLNL